MKRRQPLPIRLTAKITAVAAAAALALTGGLAVQMADGHDPELSAKAKASTGQSASDQATSSPAAVTTRTS